MIGLVKTPFASGEFDSLPASILGWSQTGSAYICSPPVTDTDRDYIVHIRPDAAEWLAEQGFEPEGSPKFYTGNDNGGFISWRRGNLNLITTESEHFFARFLSATMLAKRLNLTEKADRIALFQVALYGVNHFNLKGREA